MSIKFKYTGKQLEFLRKGYPSMPVRDLTPAFNKKFHTNKTEGQIKAALSRNKIQCGRKPGERLMPCRLYNSKKVKFLKTNYAGRNIEELTKLFNRRFSRDMTQRQIKSFVHNRGIYCGRTGRFEKGHKAWNAGTKGQGLASANRGSYKKGNIPKTIKPLGSERLSKDGFIEIKIAEKNPYTGCSTRYKCKHVHIWEQIHGPVPHGFCVAFKDGNSLNCAPENLMLVSRAELLQLNQRHYKEMPNELKPSILALSKLAVKIGEVRKNAG